MSRIGLVDTYTDLLVFLSAYVLPFGGTFVAVFMAFALERGWEHRQDRREFLETRRTILDSVIENSLMTLELTRAPITRDVFSRQEIEVWEAVKTRYTILCHDPAEKAEFARFFGKVRKLEEALRFLREASVHVSTDSGFSRGNVEAQVIAAGSESVTLAESIHENGTTLIKRFGSGEQRERFAKESRPIEKKP